MVFATQPWLGQDPVAVQTILETLALDGAVYANF